MTGPLELATRKRALTSSHEDVHQVWPGLAGGWLPLDEPDRRSTECQVQVLYGRVRQGALPQEQGDVHRQGGEVELQNTGGQSVPGHAFLGDPPCVDCGESDPIVLTFDHLSDKITDVAKMIQSYSWAAVEREIAKCDVRCFNCHMRRTAHQRGWYKTRQ